MVFGSRGLSAVSLLVPEYDRLRNGTRILYYVEFGILGERARGCDVGRGEAAGRDLMLWAGGSGDDPNPVGDKFIGRGA